MRKKSLVVSIFIIVSLMAFGCSNSAAPSDTSSGYTKSDSKDKSSNNNQDNSKDNKSQENNSKDNNQSQEIANTQTVNKKNGQYVICIDPGHQTKGDMSQEPVAPGSSEKKFKVSWGTQGVATKIPEYELTLSASKILKKDLEQMGFKVIMTRETNDVNITNSERAIFANDNNADLVIRIHADGSDDSSTTGASLHIPSQDSQYTSKIYHDSNECAKLISLQMKQDGFKVNSIYQRSDLTGFNWSKVPVVLVEMGFMSNPEEDQKMAETSYQEKMMKSVAEGAQSYFENK
ncbi:N-acetylmuramoyl-L-alanine amidase [Intestinibacter bartlettii]|uniref:N-acetylmuramoyl-L-alanine amidase n=1 Tax=Intestinibacter bartlettii CAG:1329 TaxID=1263063 RepID=R5Y1L0_9FIRM|nr:N-acetylmuramoyl-L-alanine amidase [Intestinibacter bartlettii]CDA10527.1 n-acetylmuramoyl-L-alanine amidase [Intestinibacter bartlettii CAG:1329]